MIIREATKADIEPVLELVHEFQRESIDKYNMFCDDDFARKYMAKMIKTTLIMEKDNKIIGLISGIITDYILSTTPIFQEVIWFVTKQYRKYGIKLLKELERRCKLAGINQIIMVTLGEEMHKKLNSFYRRTGYNYLESQYIKNL